MIFVSLICALLIGASNAANNAYQTTPQLVKNLEYPFEIHQFTTTDGYILVNHRIPYGKNGSGSGIRVPVLVQHGLVGDSSGFVNNNQENQQISLGFLLADAGYDVWLLNSRGNFYSREHATKSRFDPTFFDFSYHEIGIYDLPETIDFVRNKTGVDKVVHIGHSQGNTAMWVMLSEKPEYNSKLDLHISYAPVAFHTHTKNPLFRFMSYIESTGILSSMAMRLFEVPRNWAINIFLITSCSNWSPFRFICEWIYYEMNGYNSEELNKTNVANIYGHFPSQSSIKQFTHFVQAVNKPVFAQFDYKLIGNWKKYGKPAPPHYNLSRVQVPVFSFYGGRDRFCQQPDVDKLHSLLPNLREKHFIDHWAHYDFLHGINAKEIVYDPTIKILQDNLK